MIVVFNESYQNFENKLLDCIVDFDSKGDDFIIGTRNRIKLFSLDELTINIKSFKIPSFINKIIYEYFRKSKAKRSFEFANKLITLGIGTPDPIGFIEFYSFFGLQKSFYISQQLKCDLTFRELVEIPNYPDNLNILKQFTQFSFDLHEKGIEFLDHSPGNTLIKKNDEGKYDFFLVDLNRMNFHQSMPFEMRMKNLCRLTPHKEMLEVIANEYAKLSGISEKKIFETLLKLTINFQEKFYRKKRLKRKFMFWK
ncbi:Kdo domain containing protein [Flavobacterium sp.]|uniref:Kdo domain containing protein n=1 Tax=Flavobacterium sp. TaxID=239 RepID=UPI0037506345